MSWGRRQVIGLIGGILGLGLAACGGDDGSVLAVIPPEAPVVTVFNPPTTIRLGETVVFPVQVNASRGVQQFNFLQITVEEPNQTRPTESIDPSAFGCQVGDTVCGPADFAFRVGADARTGTYRITFIGFDQTGQGSVPVTVFLSAFR